MFFSNKRIQVLRFLIQAFFMGALIIGVHLNAWKWLLVPIFIFGVFFCGWVCPFGTLQEWCRKIADKMGIKLYKLPQRFQKYAFISRYLFLAFSLLGITWGILDARKTFTDNVFSGTGEAAAYIIMGIFILASFFTPRPFCNYFCMGGARMGLYSVVRFFGVRRNQKCCIHCHKCTRACPMNIPVEELNFVRHPNCINCFKCIGSCPKNCLAYTKCFGTSSADEEHNDSHNQRV